VNRGVLTDAEWRIFDPLLPGRGERGPPKAAHGQRHPSGPAHRRAVARHAKPIRQSELGFRALYPREQACGLGRSLRETGFARAACRRRACFDSIIVRAHHHAAGVTGGIRRSKRSAARAAASRPKSTSARTPKQLCASSSANWDEPRQCFSVRLRAVSASRPRF
jgi:transposase